MVAFGRGITGPELFKVFTSGPSTAIPVSERTFLEAVARFRCKVASVPPERPNDPHSKESGLQTGENQLLPDQVVVLRVLPPPTELVQDERGQNV